VKKRIPVLITELFTGKNLFDFACFIKYFDFMKHGTLQTYAYPGDIRPGLEDILSASAQMMDHRFGSV
jgi:hypothetical protein